MIAPITVKPLISDPAKFLQGLLLYVEAKVNTAKIGIPRPKTLPADQAKALVVWMDYCGRMWKTRLRQAWATGRWPNDFPFPGVLQRLRNENARYIDLVNSDDLRRQVQLIKVRQAVEALDMALALDAVNLTGRSLLAALTLKGVIKEIEESQL